MIRVIMIWVIFVQLNTTKKMKKRLLGKYAYDKYVKRINIQNININNMSKIMDSITAETIEQIDEYYDKNKKISAKTISQIITNIVTNYDTLTNEEKEIGKNIICKLSEKYVFTEKNINSIAEKKIFPYEQNQIWLKNLCKNGYSIKPKQVRILGEAYYHILVEGNDIKKIIQKIHSELLGRLGVNYKFLGKLLKEKNITFHIEYSEILYNAYDLSCGGIVDMFPMTKNYLQFLISSYERQNLDYDKYIKDKIITKFSDVFPNGNIVANKILGIFKVQNIIDKLIKNGIWPQLEDLNKFGEFGCYKFSRNIVKYFFENKLINKLSEFPILYGKIYCDLLDVQEIINMCIANNITLDANYIEYISFNNNANDKQFELHQINISKLLTGENLDIQKLISVACKFHDEILFNKIIEYAQENNISEDKLFINANELLDIAMLNTRIKSLGMNILKKLLNMKAEPKKEHIKIKNLELLRLFISYGLQIDDDLLDTIMKKNIVIDFEEFGYDNNEKICEYCDKYNFFPKEYQKYFNDKMSACIKINKIFDNYHIIEKTLTEDDIIKIFEENKIVPKIAFYEKVVARKLDKLVTYFEDKHKMCPGYTPIFEMKDYVHIHNYMRKFIEYHKLSRLSKSRRRTNNVV